MEDLQDKIGLVIGASAGIGKTIAQNFVREGAHVVICDLDAKAGQEVANAVLWLVSEKASLVTGQALATDGGWVAK